MAVVTGGSSQYTAHLVETFEKLLRKMIGKMTGKQAMIVILGISALITGGWAWSSFLDQTRTVKLEELKGKDHQAAMKSIEISNSSNNETIRKIVEVLEKQGFARR